MKKALRSLLSLVALSLVPAQTASAQLLMGWGDSPTNGAPTELSIDCQSNLGTSELVVSYVPVADITGVTGFTLWLSPGSFGEYGSPWNPPPYWDLGPGGCRAGTFSGDPGFTSVALADPNPVTNPWQDLSVTLRSWEHMVHLPDPWGWPDTAYAWRYKLDCALLPGSTVTLHAGQEYYLATYTIRHDTPAGPGGCSGCCTYFTFYPSLCFTSGCMPAPVFAFAATWSGWSPNPGCGVIVPTRASTWGALKSAYR